MSIFCRFILIIKVETTSFFPSQVIMCQGWFFHDALSHETMDIAQVLRGKQPGGREKRSATRAVRQYSKILSRVYILHSKKKILCFLLS